MSDYGQAGGDYGFKYRSEDRTTDGVPVPERGSPWTQYRCTSCNFPNRIRVPPSRAKMRLDSEYCERCDCNTQHVSDGGSAVIR